MLAQIEPTEQLARQLWREAVATVADRAKAALPPSVNGRIESAVKIVLAGDLEPCEGGKYVVGSQADARLHYVVDGQCECQDSDRPEINGWCKHKIATALHKRAHALLTQRLAALNAPGTPKDAQEGTITHQVDPHVDPKWIVSIHGQSFIRFIGLLQMAKGQGLVSLKADFTQVTDTYALAHAVATFADGRVYEESGDSDPGNVNKSVKPHWKRMALVRAKSRALRDALGLDMTAAEEMD
jgi:hypothetical protein